MISFFVFMPASVFSHHATVTNFTQEIIEIDGTIEKVRYQNPHSSILIKRPAEDQDDKDGVEYWLIETDAQSTLERRGVTMEILLEGSYIKASGRKGRRAYTMFLRELVLEDGSVFTSDNSEE